MKKIIILVLLFALIPLTVQAFTDVSTSTRHYKAVNFVKEKSIVKGYADGTFKPKQQINRAELVKIIVESKYDKTTIDKCTKAYFKDVSAKAWYAKYLCVAKEKGIIKGYKDGKVGPGKNVTFVEALKMIAKANGVQFTEGKLWYEDLVKKTGNDNLIPLTITKFDQQLNRGEVADMIARFTKNKEGKLNDYLGDEKGYKVNFDTITNGTNVDTTYQSNVIQKQSCPVTPSTSSSSTSTCDDCPDIRKYNCPYLLEYEFSQSLQQKIKDGKYRYVSGGLPFVRFKKAEIKNGELICEYDKTFADSSYMVNKNFAFQDNGSVGCQTFLSLGIKDKAKSAPGWQKESAFIKVDKLHNGHRDVVGNMYGLSGGEWQCFTHPGCVYDRTLQNGFSTNLKRNVDGACRLNSDKNGFECADTLSELLGTTIQQVK